MSSCFSYFTRISIMKYAVIKVGIFEYVRKNKGTYNKITFTICNNLQFFCQLSFQHYVAFNWKSYLLSSHMTMIWPEEKERVSLPNTQIHSSITFNWSVFCRMQLKKEGRELKVAVVSLSFHEQQRKSDWTHAIRVFLLWATKSSFCIRLAWSKVNTVHYFSSLW